MRAERTANRVANAPQSVAVNVVTNVAANVMRNAVKPAPKIHADRLPRRHRLRHMAATGLALLKMSQPSCASPRARRKYQDAARRL